MTINLHWVWALFINLFLAQAASAELVAQPDQIVRDRYGAKARIISRNILVTAAEAKRLAVATGLEVSERVFNFMEIREDSKLRGHAALLVRKIKTKNQATLYFISPEGKIEAIELIAFYEPAEYRPEKEWLKQFSGKGAADRMKLRNEIRVVSGATLTAQSFVQAARLALAVWEQHVRGIKP